MLIQTDRKFRKRERLCSQKVIGDLFTFGNVLKLYPFKVVYTCSPYNQSPVKIVISVPKKIHRKAVRRNLIRRRIREAYRLNKQILYEIAGAETTLNIMFIYISSNIANYAEIEKKFIKTLSSLAENIKKNNDIHTDIAD